MRRESQSRGSAHCSIARLRLRPTTVQTQKSMTLRIERISSKGKKRIRLSGEFRSEHVDQVKTKLASEDVLIAVPHSSFFPPLGRLRKEGSGYSWAPVVFTDQWDGK
jgi:hypothetical protein